MPPPPHLTHPSPIVGLALAGLACLAGCAVPTAPSPGTTADATTTASRAIDEPEADAPLAIRTAPYFEDALVPRIVAAITARLWRRGDDVALTIDLAPSGDLVEAMPGLDGVPGHNARTAEELAALLDERDLAVETRWRTGSSAGRIAHVEHGRLPARALAREGRVRPVADPRTLPVLVRLDAGALPFGESHTYVVARGVPRLRVDVERRSGDARIVAIGSLAEIPSARTSR